MKRREALAILLAALLLLGVAASGGAANDPLISRNYLENTFLSKLISQAQEKIEKAIPLQSGQQGGTEELRVKRGDLLTLKTGSTITALAGGLWCSPSAGTVVDLTGGKPFEQAGGPLAANHRYLSAEQSVALISVTSDTAVVLLTGPYELTPSANTDYNALAYGLKTLGLFRGSDTPYGSGFDLELMPTRIQGLIMFIRLLGEESLALTYSHGEVQFPDVPQWALPYVIYAYEKGYTKGRNLPDEENRVWFGTTDTLAARDYVTFLLRALGFAEGTQFQWATAIQDAQALNVLTAGEGALLTEKPFLRAQVVYLSFYALETQAAGQGGTLADRLISKEVFQADALARVRSGLSTSRL